MTEAGLQPASFVLFQNLFPSNTIHSSLSWYLE